MGRLIIITKDRKKNPRNDTGGQLERKAGQPVRCTRGKYPKKMEESSQANNEVHLNEQSLVENQNECDSSAPQQLALRRQQRVTTKPGAYSISGPGRACNDDDDDDDDVENALSVDCENSTSTPEDSIIVPEASLVSEHTPVVIGKEIRWYQKGRNMLILIVVLICVGGVAIVLPVVATKEKSSPTNTSDQDTELPMYTGRWRQVGSINGQASADRLGTSSKISANGRIVAVGSGIHTFYAGGTQNGRPGYLDIFSWSREDDTGSSQLVPHATIKGKEDDDLFGWSLDLSASGDRIAVGSPGGGAAQRGLVRVYQNNVNSSEWSLIGTDILAPEDGQLNLSLPDVFDSTVFPNTFGFALSTSADGNTVAVGDPSYSLSDSSRYGSGAVHIYRYDEAKEDWLQLGNTIVGSSGGDLFGWAVSLSASGKRLAVGSPGTGPLQGQVRVFDLLPGNIWKQIGSDLNGLRPSGEYGNSVSLSATGDLLAVGANRHNGGQLNEIVESGMVQVFQFNGTAWQQVGQNLYGRSDGDIIGWSLSLAKNVPVVAIGGIQSGSGGAGTVRVFEWNGTGWQMGDLDLFGEDSGDEFGSSLCLSADGWRLVVGAWKNDGGKGLKDAGQIRMYESS